MFFLLITLHVAPDLSAKLVFANTSISDKAELGAEKFPFSFEFENKGDQTVEIQQVKTSCGCTTAELNQKVYQPGDSGEITGTFSIGNRLGKQKKTVTLFTDNLGQPEIKLSIEVEIPKFLSIKPGLVYWHQSSTPEPKAIYLQAYDESVTIQNVECNSDFFSAKLSGPNEIGIYKLIITPLVLNEAKRAVIRIHAKYGEGTSKTFFAHAMVK